MLIARSPEAEAAASLAAASASSQAGFMPRPLVRKRRRLPVIDRPKSAPLSGETCSEDTVLDVCDLSNQQAAMKTVIKVTS
jgi:hypothetical protein